MFSRLLSWLGWETSKSSTSKAKRIPAARPRSATAHLFEKAPPRKSRAAASAAADTDFNPYNTGKFDRSASWERISKNQR